MDSAVVYPPVVLGAEGRRLRNVVTVSFGSRKESCSCSRAAVRRGHRMPCIDCCLVIVQWGGVRSCAIASPETTARQRLPNSPMCETEMEVSVEVLLSDYLSADDLGCTGHSRPTAIGRGVVVAEALVEFKLHTSRAVESMVTDRCCCNSKTYPSFCLISFAQLR